MDVKEMATLLNGREYGEEMTKKEEKAALAAGLVIVFGASDDLMEFRGAIDEEIDAYRGREVLVDAEGIIPAFQQLLDDTDREIEFERYFRRKPNAKKIEAVWDSDGYSWIYRTEIPHETFDILEDGNKYCRGIVFALSALAAAT